MGEPQLGAFLKRLRPAGYGGKLVTWAAVMLHLVVAIVRKRPGQSTFEVLPRR